MSISQLISVSSSGGLRRDRGLLRTSRSPFRGWAYVGFVCALVVTTILATRLRLSLWIILLIVSSWISMFALRVLFSRVVGRSQQLVFYRYFVTMIGFASALLWVMRRPVLPYLDVTVIGLAAFVACGRIGCLMVGCCHGRPSKFGVCYREQHITPAFPVQLLGVRLFPIQAAEALWLLCIVIAGMYEMWNEHAPGTGIGLFMAAYCPARFIFEFLRWRPGNFSYRGLSEAQLTSVALVILLVIAEFVGLLPFSRPHSLIAFALAAVTIVVVASSKGQRHKAQLKHSDEHERDYCS
jgi:prolipoprotein diacylglyceryltransferase